MPRNFLGSLVLAALAALSTACDVSVKVINTSESAVESSTGSEQPTQGEDASSEGADSSSSRGEEEASDSSSSSSTGDFDSSSSGSPPAGTTDDSEESPLTPTGEACAQDEECESGLCGLGECVQLAEQPCEDAPAQCGDGMNCVTFAGGDACLDTGADTQGGEAAVNDSPEGDIDESDLDVWEIANLPAGSYTVKLKADSAGGELFILAADGSVLANPASGVQPDDIEAGFIEYTITLDAPQPAVTVIVRGIYHGNLPYYFYTVIL